MLTYLHKSAHPFQSFRNHKTIIVAHGYAASSENVLFFADVLDPNRDYNWIFPRAPFLVPEELAGRNACAWFPNERENALHQQAINGQFFSKMAEIDIPEIQESAAQLHTLIQTLGIDPAKTVLGGFSQGAIISAEYALQCNDRFAGMLLYSGSIIAEQRWKEITPPHTIPYFQTHGTVDDVLPLSAAEKLHAYLQQRGFSGEFFTFNDGHTITEEVLLKTRAKLDVWLK